MEISNKYMLDSRYSERIIETFLDDYKSSLSLVDPRTKLQPALQVLGRNVDKTNFARALLQAGEFLSSEKKYALAIEYAWNGAKQIIGEINPVPWSKQGKKFVMTEGYEVFVIKMKILLGSASCEILNILEEDKSFLRAHTLNSIVSALQKIQSAIQEIVDIPGESIRDSLSWIVFNGTVLLSRYSLMVAKFGFGKYVVEFLNYSILCLESILSLVSVRYLPFRVDLYIAVSKIYDKEKGKKIIQRGLYKLKELDSWESVNKNKSPVLEDMKRKLLIYWFKFESQNLNSESASNLLKQIFAHDEDKIFALIHTLTETDVIFDYKCTQTALTGLPLLCSLVEQFFSDLNSKLPLISHVRLIRLWVSSGKISEVGVVTQYLQRRWNFPEFKSGGSWVDDYSSMEEKCKIILDFSTEEKFAFLESELLLQLSMLKSEDSKIASLVKASVVLSKIAFVKNSIAGEDRQFEEYLPHASLLSVLMFLYNGYCVPLLKELAKISSVSQFLPNRTNPRVENHQWVLQHFLSCYTSDAAYENNSDVRPVIQQILCVTLSSLFEICADSMVTMDCVFYGNMSLNLANLLHSVSQPVQAVKVIETAVGIIENFRSCGNYEISVEKYCKELTLEKTSQNKESLIVLPRLFMPTLSYETKAANENIDVYNKHDEIAVLHVDLIYSLKLMELEVAKDKALSHITAKRALDAKLYSLSLRPNKKIESEIESIDVDSVELIHPASESRLINNCGKHHFERALTLATLATIRKNGIELLQQALDEWREGEKARNNLRELSEKSAKVLHIDAKYALGLYGLPPPPIPTVLSVSSNGVWIKCRVQEDYPVNKSSLRCVIYGKASEVPVEITTDHIGFKGLGIEYAPDSVVFIECPGKESYCFAMVIVCTQNNKNREISEISRCTDPITPVSDLPGVYVLSKICLVAATKNLNSFSFSCASTFLKSFILYSDSTSAYPSHLGEPLDIHSISHIALSVSPPNLLRAVARVLAIYSDVLPISRVTSGTSASDRNAQVYLATVVRSLALCGQVCLVINDSFLTMEIIEYLYNRILSLTAINRNAGANWDWLVQSIMVCLQMIESVPKEDWSLAVQTIWPEISYFLISLLSQSKQNDAIKFWVNYLSNNRLSQVEKAEKKKPLVESGCIFIGIGSSRERIEAEIVVKYGNFLRFISSLGFLLQSQSFPLLNTPSYKCFGMANIEFSVSTLPLTEAFTKLNEFINHPCYIGLLVTLLKKAIQNGKIDLATLWWGQSEATLACYEIELLSLRQKMLHNKKLNDFEKTRLISAEVQDLLRAEAERGQLEIGVESPDATLEAAPIENLSGDVELKSDVHRFLWLLWLSEIPRIKAKLQINFSSKPHKFIATLKSKELNSFTLKSNDELIRKRISFFANDACFHMGESNFDFSSCFIPGENCDEVCKLLATINSGFFLLGTEWNSHRVSNISSLEKGLSEINKLVGLLEIVQYKPENTFATPQVVNTKVDPKNKADSKIDQKSSNQTLFNPCSEFDFYYSTASYFVESAQLATSSKAWGSVLNLAKEMWNFLGVHSGSRNGLQLIGFTDLLLDMGICLNERARNLSSDTKWEDDGTVQVSAVDNSGDDTQFLESFSLLILEVLWFSLDFRRAVDFGHTLLNLGSVSYHIAKFVHICQLKLIENGQVSSDLQHSVLTGMDATFLNAREELMKKRDSRRSRAAKQEEETKIVNLENNFKSQRLVAFTSWATLYASFSYDIREFAPYEEKYAQLNSQRSSTLKEYEDMGIILYEFICQIAAGQKTSTNLSVKFLTDSYNYAVTQFGNFSSALRRRRDMTMLATVLSDIGDAHWSWATFLANKHVSERSVSESEINECYERAFSSWSDSLDATLQTFRAYSKRKILCNVSTPLLHHYGQNSCLASILNLYKLAISFSPKPMHISNPAVSYRNRGECVLFASAIIASLFTGSVSHPGNFSPENGVILNFYDFMMSPEHVILNGVDNVKIGLMKDALLFFIRELIEELGQPMQSFPVICLYQYYCKNDDIAMNNARIWKARAMIAAGYLSSAFVMLKQVSDSKLVGSFVDKLAIDHPDNVSVLEQFFKEDIQLTSSTLEILLARIYFCMKLASVVNYNVFKDTIELESNIRIKCLDYCEQQIFLRLKFLSSTADVEGLVDCYYLLAQAYFLRRQITNSINNCLRGLVVSCSVDHLFKTKEGSYMQCDSKTNIRQLLKLRVLLCRCYLEQNRLAECLCELDLATKLAADVADHVCSNTIFEIRQMLRVSKGDFNAALDSYKEYELTEYDPFSLSYGEILRYASLLISNKKYVEVYERLEVLEHHLVKEALRYGVPIYPNVSSVEAISISTVDLQGFDQDVVRNEEYCANFTRLCSNEIVNSIASSELVFGLNEEHWCSRSHFLSCFPSLFQCKLLLIQLRLKFSDLIALNSESKPLNLPSCYHSASESNVLEHALKNVDQAKRIGKFNNGVFSPFIRSRLEIFSAIVTQRLSGNVLKNSTKLLDCASGFATLGFQTVEIRTALLSLCQLAMRETDKRKLHFLFFILQASKAAEVELQSCSDLYTAPNGTFIPVSAADITKFPKFLLHELKESTELAQKKWEVENPELVKPKSEKELRESDSFAVKLLNIKNEFNIADLIFQRDSEIANPSSILLRDVFLLYFSYRRAWVLLNDTNQEIGSSSGISSSINPAAFSSFVPQTLWCLLQLYSLLKIICPKFVERCTSQALLLQGATEEAALKSQVLPGQVFAQWLPVRVSQLLKPAIDKKLELLCCLSLVNYAEEDKKDDKKKPTIPAPNKSVVDCVSNWVQSNSEPLKNLMPYNRIVESSQADAQFDCFRLFLDTSQINLLQDEGRKLRVILLNNRVHLGVSEETDLACEEQFHRVLILFYNLLSEKKIEPELFEKFMSAFRVSPADSSQTLFGMLTSDLVAILRIPCSLKRIELLLSFLDADFGVNGVIDGYFSSYLNLVLQSKKIDF